MTRAYFVTGTDTGVGKTWCTVALVHALQAAGRTPIVMKPVASGCTLRDGAWVNDDALKLMEACAIPARYADVNPYAFAEPVSPHIAAQLAATRVDLQHIVDIANRLRQTGEPLLVEGAGGWMSPLDQGLWQANVVKALDAGVLLVVGLRLGCINHALLSARAIADDGCRLIGWIGNRVEQNMLAEDAVIETLAGNVDAPCLGVLPWGGTTPSAALDLGVLGY